MNTGYHFQYLMYCPNYRKIVKIYSGAVQWASCLTRLYMKCKDLLYR